METLTMPVPVITDLPVAIVLNRPRLPQRSWQRSCRKSDLARLASLLRAVVVPVSNMEWRSKTKWKKAISSLNPKASASMSIKPAPCISKARRSTTSTH